MQIIRLNRKAIVAICIVLVLNFFLYLQFVNSSKPTHHHEPSRRPVPLAVGALDLFGESLKAVRSLLPTTHASGD